MDGTSQNAGAILGGAEDHLYGNLMDGTSRIAGANSGGAEDHLYGNGWTVPPKMQEQFWEARRITSTVIGWTVPPKMQEQFWEARTITSTAIEADATLP